MGVVIPICPEPAHFTGPAVCLDCKHEWVAVAPVGTVYLECPKCGTEKGRSKYPIQYSGLEWQCQCGNNLFHITPDGCYCPCCGVYQSGF